MPKRNSFKHKLKFDLFDNKKDAEAKRDYLNKKFKRKKYFAFVTNAPIKIDGYILWYYI